MHRTDLFRHDLLKPTTNHHPCGCRLCNGVVLYLLSCAISSSHLAQTAPDMPAPFFSCSLLLLLLSSPAPFFYRSFFLLLPSSLAPFFSFLLLLPCSPTPPPPPPLLFTLSLPHLLVDNLFSTVFVLSVLSDEVLDSKAAIRCIEGSSTDVVKFSTGVVKFKFPIYTVRTMCLRTAPQDVPFNSSAFRSAVSEWVRCTMRFDVTYAMCLACIVG